MTLAELIMADAKARGLQHYFGLPGSGIAMDIMEAGRRVGVEFVSVAHESSAAIMGAYNGIMQGTAGLALTIKGPGAGNLVGGAVNAYFERMPLVCLCEAAPTHLANRELVQKCDQDGLFGAVVKYSDSLTAAQGAASIRAAVFQATDGRPGPALLNIPTDMAQAECADFSNHNPPTPVAEPTASELTKMKTLIEGAGKVVIIAGADIVRADAMSELLELAEHSSAAVLVTTEARGVIPESHRRWAGVFTGIARPHITEALLLAKADLVLLVGVDSMMSESPWQRDLPTCELVSRAEYETLSPAPQARVNGNLKTALQGLLPDGAQPGFGADEIQSLRNKGLENFRRPDTATFAAQDVVSIMRTIMPPESMLFSETGAFVLMLEHLWPVERPGRFWGTTGGRTMGLTVPAMLGAKLAQPDIPMAGIGADGSLLMRLGELEVLARTGVAAPLVILNDQALGTMKSRQRSRQMPAYGLDLHAVDFAAIATACGLRGVTVSDPEQFETEFKMALQADRTTLIDARIDPRPYQDSFAAALGPDHP